MNILKAILVGLLAIFISCTSNKIGEPVPVDCSISTLDFTVAITDADCGQNNGEIIIAASGGEPPYNYAIDDPAMQTTNTIDKLKAGNYTIIITDNVKCSVSKAILVASKGGFQATALLTPSGCKTTNGAITVQPVNGVLPYTYKIGSTSQAEATFNNLASGQYEVLITDATGCDFSLIETVLTGVSYTSTIKPIINNSCAVTGCHDGSTAQTNFTSFSNVQGKAADIKSRTQSGSMPKNSTLTQAQKDAIACWVDDGAIDN